MIGRDRAGKRLHIIYDDDGIAFFDDDGTQIANHPRPPKGTRYIGNDKPRGFMATPTTVHEALRHPVSTHQGHLRSTMS